MPNGNLNIIPMDLSLFYDVSLCHRLAPNVSFSALKSSGFMRSTQKEVSKYNKTQYLRTISFQVKPLCFGFTLNE